MSAYVVAEITITDPARYEEYKPLAAASVAAYGGRYVVRGGAVDSLEGTPVEGRFVILEFPDLDGARRWYHSEDYGGARAIRQTAATARVFIADGLQPG